MTNSKEFIRSSKISFGIFSNFGAPNVSVVNCTAFFFMASLYHKRKKSVSRQKPGFGRELVTKGIQKKTFLVFRLVGYQKSPCCQGEKLLRKTRK